MQGAAMARQLRTLASLAEDRVPFLASMQRFITTCSSRAGASDTLLDHQRAPSMHMAHINACKTKYPNTSATEMKKEANVFLRYNYRSWISHTAALCRRCTRSYTLFFLRLENCFFIHKNTCFSKGALKGQST